MFTRLLLLVATVGLFSGCAVGNQHTYHLATPGLRYQGTVTVAVAVHDQRAYVLKGEEKPDFVGLSRGGFGNTFGVTTESKNPLAVDFANATARGLGARGYRVTPVATSAGQPKEQVVAALAKTGAARLVVIQLLEWKSDTYQNTALIYDVTASVLDAQRRVLGQARIQGNDNLGGAFNAAGHAKEVIPPAYLRKLEQLLNDPSILAGLHDTPPAPSPSAPPAVAPAVPEAPAAAPPAPEPAAAPTPPPAGPAAS